MDKQTLRKEALAKRKAIDTSYAQSAALALAQNIVKNIKAGKHVIAGYAPTRGEIDIFPALSLLSEKGHTLCLPVVDHIEAPLVFRTWKPGALLIKGSYAIDIPESGEAVIPDIILTPLVAFDAAGNRLGYGAGYYDRTIAQLRSQNNNMQVIGIAYATQQLESIPTEPQDATLDFIITEKWIIGRE